MVAAPVLLFSKSSWLSRISNATVDEMETGISLVFCI